MNEYQEELVESHIGLARSIAFKFKNVTNVVVDMDDLIQESYVALIKAALLFDGSSGNQFSTYAYPYIWGKLRILTICNRPGISVSSRVSDAVFDITKAGLVDEKDISVIADKVINNYSNAVILTALDIINNQNVASLHKVLGDKEDSYLLDIQPGRSGNVEEWAIVHEFMDSLKPKYRTILILKLMGYQSREIGKVMGYCLRTIESYRMHIKQFARDYFNEEVKDV